MKKIVTLFVGLMVTFSLLAQDSKTGPDGKRKRKQTYLSQYSGDSRKRVLDSDFEKLDSTISRVVFDGQLQNFYKEFFEYDVNGNLIRNIDYSWNSQTQTWVNDQRWDFVYNEAGQVTTVTGYVWSSGQWVLDTRETVAYDENGNATEYQVQQRNVDAGQWVNDFRNIRTYSGENRLTSSSDFIWSGSAWVPISLTNYEYNQQGQLILETEYVLNDDNQVASERSLYEYDSNGNRTEQLIQTWNGDWTDQSRHLYVYNENNQLIEETIQRYQASVWVNETRFVYSYSFTADESNLKLPVFFYELNGETDVNALANSEEFRWDAGSNTWELVAERQLSFSEFESPITGYKQVASAQLSIYPNPTSEGIWIATASAGKSVQVEVYSLQGQMLFQKSLTNQSFMSMDMLDKGTYLLKIYSDNIVKTERVIYR